MPTNNAAAFAKKSIRDHNNNYKECTVK